MREMNKSAGETLAQGINATSLFYVLTKFVGVTFTCTLGYELIPVLDPDSALHIKQRLLRLLLFFPLTSL